MDEKMLARHFVNVSRASLLRLSCVALFLTIGCGPGNELPTPVKVIGKVTYQGAALADVVVTFVPDKAPSPSSGPTNTQGEFELTTYAAGDGAFVGHHKVTISPKPTGGTPGASSVDGADYAKAMEAMQAPKTKSPEEPRFPAKYRAAETSDLEFTVQADAPNNATFELKD